MLTSLTEQAGCFFKTALANLFCWCAVPGAALGLSFSIRNRSKELAQNPRRCSQPCITDLHWVALQEPILFSTLGPTSTGLWHLLDVLQFSSIPALSTWMQPWIPQMTQGSPRSSCCPGFYALDEVARNKSPMWRAAQNTEGPGVYRTERGQGYHRTERRQGCTGQRGGRDAQDEEGRGGYSDHLPPLQKPVSSPVSSRLVWA